MTVPGPTVSSGNNKAIAAVLGGALSTIVVYMVEKLTHQPMPADISAAVQTVVVTVLVWLVPHGGTSN
jgi:cobalamin biosynthesis protein CobD/CbiB